MAEVTEGGSRSSRNRLATIVTGLVALAVIGGVILGGPYRGPSGWLVQVGLVIAAAGGGLVLRRLDVGEPVVDRPGWRWLGAGVLLYLVGVFFSFVLVASVGAGTAWWERLLSEGIGLAVVLATPLAVGPEAAGGRA